MDPAKETLTSRRALAELMGVRPMVGSALSIVGGLSLLLSASIAMGNTVLFVGAVVSGILILILGVMLYARPKGHSLWGVAVVVVSLLDIIGSIYFFYAPGMNGSVLITALAALSPLIALLGGVAGLLWKTSSETQLPVSKRPNTGSS